MMFLRLVAAGLGFSIASIPDITAVATRSLHGITRRPEALIDTLCLQVMQPDSLPVLGENYIDGKTLLRLRDELAPIISDTTKLPGHPRHALQVISARVSTPDYAAWWRRTADSVALFWRFGLGRGVYVAAAQSGDDDLSGRLFLTAGARHTGPIAFRAKRVACTVPPAT